MAIYILFPVLLIVSGVFLCKNDSSKIHRIIYVSVFGAAVFGLQASRYMVGTDYYSYAEMFKSLRLADTADMSVMPFEKGFASVMHIMSEYSESFTGVFIFTALIVAVGSAMYIYKYSTNACISAVSFVCLGCFFYSMNFMRQFIAAVIVMYAMRYIHEKSFFRYVILILLAATFHWSALVLLPFYFILKIKLEPLIIAAFSLFAIMLFVFSDEIISFGVNVFYQKYMNSETADIGNGVSLYYVIGYGILLLIGIMLRKKLYERDPANVIYLNCLFFAVMFELLGFRHALLSRFALLFIVPCCIVLVPEIVGIVADKFTKEEKDNAKRMLAYITVMCVFAGFGGIFYGCMLSNNSNGVVPYRTVYEYNIHG